jgi:hypothetical protein
MRRLQTAILGLSLVAGGLACSPNGGGGGGSGDDGGNTVPCADGGTVTLNVTGPSCLWAPDHKMVLYTLSDVTAETTGSCTVPSLSIVGITSNQPATGSGSGNFSPDYTFNSTGLCLREERDGTSSDPRIYTITFQATDGNITVQKSIEVFVDHSQDGVACPSTDPSRIVGEDDPRCN